MTPIQDIYLVSAGIGFLYIVGSAFLGGLHMGGHQGGHGHAGGHGQAIGHGAHGTGHAIGQAGHAGGHGAAAHGSGHAAPGHAAPGHAAPGHAAPGHAAPGHAAGAGHPGAGHAGSGHAGAGHAGSGHGGTGHGPNQAQGSGARPGAQSIPHGHSEEIIHPLQSSTVTRSANQVPRLFLKAIEVFSPTKLAFFSFLFGAIGFISLQFLPGYLSFAPAAIGGWVLANWFFGLMSNMMARMYSSTNFKKESLVGCTGQVTVSIEEGGIGEVLITTGNSRYTSAARAKGDQQTIKKLAKVIVVDIKDGIFLIEPFDDPDLNSKY